MIKSRITPFAPSQFLCRVIGISILFCAPCTPVQAQVATDALVTGAYDGDTVYVEAAIWPNMTWTGGIRVLGVDTPEIRGRCELEKKPRRFVA